jgi:8-oxo-dGTP pyrophosphatase MutT (NUDIX family)
MNANDGTVKAPLTLSKKQIEALDQYQLLMEDYPQLFTQRQARCIVDDFAILFRYVRDTGSVLGVAAATPYHLFVVDLIEAPKTNGQQRFYCYARLIDRQLLQGGTNVAVLGVISERGLGRLGDVVLVCQERHGTGTFECEIPRGFGCPRETGETSALRELEEETGYVGDEAIKLGETLTDTGIGDNRVCFYLVPILRSSSFHPESTEAIKGIKLVGRGELWADIFAGRVRDSFTIQVLCFFESRSIVHQVASTRCRERVELIGSACELQL